MNESWAGWGCPKCGYKHLIGPFLRHCAGTWWGRLLGDCPRVEHLHLDCLGCGYKLIAPVADLPGKAHG